MEDRGELKLVLHLKGDRALVGVQQQGTDPIVEPVPAATLEELLGAVPGLVARARERWAQSPRNPAYQGPPIAPPPPPPPAVQTTRRQEPVREGRMNQMF